jgi:CBS domain-containing protein
MTESPVSVDAGLNIVDAQDRMHANNIRHLLVTFEERVVGVVSNRDLAMISAIEGVDPTRVPVSRAATLPPFASPATAPVDEVVREMERNKWGSAIVVDAQNRAVGIFTTTDALQALRQVVEGRREVEPETQPTHEVEHPEQRDQVVHTVRAGEEAEDAMPSPDQGLAFDLHNR